MSSKYPTEISATSDSRSRTFSPLETLYDDAQLQRLGKRPVLNRSFGFMSILGFSCSALLSWEGVLVTSVPGLLNGGPAGVIYGFLINWIGTLSVYTVLAELASIAPTTGGQCKSIHSFHDDADIGPITVLILLALWAVLPSDHWVSMMAPKSCNTFLAYLTAWLTTTAWQASAAVVGYLIATWLQGIIVLAQPAYVPTSWQTVLIFWATMLFAVIVNSTTGKVLARFEGFVLVLHLAGFFGVLVPLVYFAPHNDARTVFTTFVNEGGWSSQTLSFLVGFPLVASSFLGGDSAVHMSEEIQGAAIVVPRALLFTVFINGSLAFAMITALMFCLTDLPSALGAAETMFYPFLQIAYSALGSRVGACLMAGIILVLAIAGSVSVYASASRMLWSFSRDKGLPGHTYLVKVSNIIAIVACFHLTNLWLLSSFPKPPYLSLQLSPLWPSPCCYRSLH